jgi:hypothetical protein
MIPSTLHQSPLPALLVVAVGFFAPALVALGVLGGMTLLEHQAPAASAQTDCPAASFTFFIMEPEDEFCTDACHDPPNGSWW